MTISEANSILGMTPERLTEFMAESRRNKTLSAIVKRANASLLGKDPDARQRASAVLARMGLLDVD